MIQGAEHPGVESRENHIPHSTFYLPMSRASNPKPPHPHPLPQRERGIKRLLMTLPIIGITMGIRPASDRRSSCGLCPWKSRFESAGPSSSVIARRFQEPSEFKTFPRPWRPSIGYRKTDTSSGKYFSSIKPIGGCFSPFRTAGSGVRRGNGEIYRRGGQAGEESRAGRHHDLSDQ